MARGTSQRLYLRTGGRQVTWPAPDLASSQFRAADPPVELRTEVAKIRWGHEWIPPEAPIEERIMPDGAVHLLFVLPSPRAGGPYALALGATSEATVVRLSGRLEHVEIELRAGAAPALLGVPAGELTGRAVPLEALWRDRAAVVRDRLLDTQDPAARVRVLVEALQAARRPSETPAAVAEALRRIERVGGNLRVRALADGLGLSDRRLEQLFFAHVGLSPKAACRLARLRASVDLLAAAGSAPPPGWAEIALECGFSDQSHLANEFRALTGLSPGDFQRRAGFGFLQDGGRRGR